MEKKDKNKKIILPKWLRIVCLCLALVLSIVYLLFVSGKTNSTAQALESTTIGTSPVGNDYNSLLRGATVSLRSSSGNNDFYTIAPMPYSEYPLYENLLPTNPQLAMNLVEFNLLFQSYNRPIANMKVFEFNNQAVMVTLTNLKNTVFNFSTTGVGSNFYINVYINVLNNELVRGETSASFSFGMNSNLPLGSSFSLYDILVANNITPFVFYNDLVFLDYLQIEVYTETTSELPDILSFTLKFTRDNIVSYNDYLQNSRFAFDTVIGDKNIDFFGSLVKTVNEFLQIQILPNFRFLDILWLALAIPLVVWLLKAWLGG